MSLPEALPSAAPRGAARALLPLLAVGAIVALVFLLPSRDGATPATVAFARLAVVDVPLDPPPEWARERGRDEVLRCLDRMDWGSHAAVAAARETLARHAGSLAPEILSRLQALGDGDPVLAAKLVELLGAEDPGAPGVLDELVLRALSFSALEARAALRVLARIPHPRAVDAVRTRLFDADPEVVGFARGALAEQARRGSPEARAAILDEIESSPQDVDLAFLTVAAGFPADGRTEELLRRVALEGQGTVRFIALAGLLARDEPMAFEAFESMLRDGDAALQREVLLAAATARKVLGTDHWATWMQQDAHALCSPLAHILFAALDQGHPEAARALELLERAAGDPTASVREQVLDGLFARRHPNAIEGVRADLQVATGAGLTLVVDRIVAGPGDRPADRALRVELAGLALARLAGEPDLRDPDRVTLCRLLAAIAPEAGAEALVGHALGRGVSREVADAVADQLSTAGGAVVGRLGDELGDPQVDELLVYVAAQSRTAAALPWLERLLAAPGTAPATRRAALDCLALVQGEDREALLRRVLPALDPALQERAQLVFWNYL